MLKKYLQSCNSKEFYRNRMVPQKSILESKDVTQTEIIAPDTSNQTVVNQNQKIRLNLRQQEQKNYYTGARQKQQSLHRQGNQQSNFQLKYLSSEKKTLQVNGQELDLEETKRVEENKFRSISFSSRKPQPTRRNQNSEEKCKSNERIKVIDVFNKTPRQESARVMFGQASGFKEKIVYQSRQQASIEKQTIVHPLLHQKHPIPIIQNMSNAQPPSSSRLNDSRDILFKLQRKPTNETSNERRQRSSLKSFFMNNPLIQHNKLSSNNIKQSIQSNNKIQPPNLRIDLDKVKNDNILELLLLTTGELRDKFKQEQLYQQYRNNSEERQLKSGVKVRTSNKFPRDFFQ